MAICCRFRLRIRRSSTVGRSNQHLPVFEQVIAGRLFQYRFRAQGRTRRRTESVPRRERAVFPKVERNTVRMPSVFNSPNTGRFLRLARNWCWAKSLQLHTAAACPGRALRSQKKGFNIHFSVSGPERASANLRQLIWDDGKLGLNLFGFRTGVLLTRPVRFANYLPSRGKVKSGDASRQILTSPVREVVASQAMQV